MGPGPADHTFTRLSVDLDFCSRLYYIHMCVYVFVRRDPCTYIRLQSCFHVCACLFRAGLHVHTYIEYVYVCGYVSVCLHMYMYVYVHMYTYMYLYMYMCVCVWKPL